MSTEAAPKNVLKEPLHIVEIYFISTPRGTVLSNRGCGGQFFSVFDIPFLRTLNPKSAFSFIECGIKDPEKLIFATNIHKTELSNLTKYEIVPPPMV